MNILENLWYGNLTPAERPVVRGSEYSLALARVQKQKEELFEGLPPEVQRAVDQLLDIQIEASCLAETEAFVTGFQMGAQVLLASLPSQ